MSRVMNLVEVRVGAQARVLSIEGGHHVRRRLFALGLNIGDMVAVEGRGAFRGPFLVRNVTTGSCLAIGRGIARKIQVEGDDAG
jgi:Fe2+ transport system protein FeoA